MPARGGYQVSTANGARALYNRGMTHPSDRRFAIEDFSTHSRRGFLGQALAHLAATGLLVSAPVRARAGTDTVASALAFQANPFALGVASGDPSPTGVVLWTRVAPMPLQANGGMPNVAVEVEWEMAADEGFRSATARGRQIAYPELGHTLHVEVEGLEPGRDYFYRFKVGTERSATGRTRTLPAAGAMGTVRFGVMGCQRYEHAHFTALADLAREAPDFVYCYGDFIYEGRALQGFEDPDRFARALPAATDECFSLADYRLRYAMYRMDPNLQAASRAAPLIAIFDDHEVSNDWINDLHYHGHPPAVFLLRRAAALQAWYENLPLRRSSMPRGPDVAAYRRFEVGGLMRFNVLDTRQYRVGRFCPAKLTSECTPDPHSKDTMLGAAQEAWFAEGLKQRHAPVWTVMAQQILMARAHLVPKPDKWDRVPVARQRLFDALVDAKAPNPVALSGDLHYAVGADLKRDFDAASASPIGTEILNLAVGSNPPADATDAFFGKLKADNPHIKFLSRVRGWTLHTVSDKLWRAEFRAVSDPLRAGSAMKAAGVLSVEAGRPGIQLG